MIDLGSLNRTGSIAQDALRLGFQTTCDAGIATLFKIDDLTMEACADFKQRHLDDVKDRVSKGLEDIEKTYEYRFKREMEDEPGGWVHVSIFQLWTWLKIRKIRKIKNNQIPRRFEANITDVSQPTLDVSRGVWVTDINYNLIKDRWCGYGRDGYLELDLEVRKEILQVTTKALKCNVEYIPYDDYHATYVPDEAAKAAYEATQIGMTQLKVAIPKLSNGGVKRDPIIVGHIGNQMFIIAWFGYNRDPMSCNV